MRRIETAHVGRRMEGFAAFEHLITSRHEAADAEIVVAESRDGKDKSPSVGLLIFGERQLDVQVLELCLDFLIFLSFDLIVEILALAPGPELLVLADPAASPTPVIGRVHGQVHAVDENDRTWSDSGRIQWDGQDCFCHEARQAGWIVRDFWNGRDRELCRRVSEGEDLVGLFDAPAERTEGKKRSHAGARSDGSARGPGPAASELPDWHKDEGTEEEKGFEGVHDSRRVTGHVAGDRVEPDTCDENDDHYADTQQGLCEIFRERCKSEGERNNDEGEGELHQEKAADIGER